MTAHPATHRMFTPALGRAYFAVQAIAGSAWWISVFSLPSVRTATLGGLDPALTAALDIPLFVVASALVACGVRWAIWIAVPWTALVAAGMCGYATLTGLAGWGALAMVLAAAGSVGAGLLVWRGRLPTEWVLVGPFAFREAPAAPAGRHVARTAQQIVVFWGSFLLVLPVIITVIESRWGLRVGVPIAVPIVGAVLLTAASALGLWSGFTMSTRGAGTPLPSQTATRLVVAGPYRWVRNPMAVAGVMQGIAVGLILGSWLVVAYAVAGSLFWNWVVRPHEEADLRARFGAEFDAYAARVACWVPRLPRG
ncbi:methyltransferase family protein [Leucobacter musarum]|uniref:methyltransferase family protein n=1 Tax=Leucobacter musarum TaxID=1930747 RepID=UPI001EFA83F0|nr:isoprenylcysteine carboxylmethyltransferase family protein [Leucobacter musarum]